MKTQSSRLAITAMAAAVAAAGFLSAPADAAKAGTEVFYGLVDHVSTNNVKVTNPDTHKTISFLLVPHFNKIFKQKGTTRQQLTLENGQYVKVYYDQKLLGRPHADRILVLTDRNHVKTRVKG